MTSVSVQPGNDPTHDVSLNDGAEVFGLILDGGERAMQEIPMSSPARSFTVNQTSYTSGRGRARLSKDQAGFADSEAAYTLTEETIHNVPRTFPAYGVGAVNIDNEPDSITYMKYSVNPVAVAFTAPENFSATSLNIWLVGMASVSVCADNAGSPGTVLNTVSVGSISSWSRQRRTVSFGALAFTSGTKYWIKITPLVEFTEIGAYRGTNASYPTKQYAAGSWSDLSWTLIFSIATGEWEREFFRFDLLGAMFVTSKPKAASGSRLWVNGALGKATSATATTIVDTNQAYTADRFIGAYVRITSGTGLGQVRQITDNDTTSLTVATWDINPDTTSIFVVYATPWWKEITGHGLTKVMAQPTVAWGVVYFPQGASVNVRRMTFTAGAFAYADDGTNKASRMILYRDKVWRVLDEISTTDRYTQLMYADPKAWGTNLTFAGDVRCGSSEYISTNLHEHDGSLYVAKQDSLWRVYDNVAARLNLGIEIIPDDTNGKAMMSLGGGMYFSWSHSVERLQGSVLDDMGWWKHEGMPQGRRGFCSSIIGALAWSYAALDAGTGYSALMVHNGRGWHELYRGSEGQRIRDVFWQQNPETNPYIWFSHGYGLRYMKFPNQTLNPLEDSGMVYEPVATMVTSTLDANEPTFYKILKGIQIISKNLGSTAFIEVDYQVNNDVGSNNWTRAGRANVSPVDFVPIAADGKGSITQMRLRFRLVTEVSTTPAIMYSWQAQGHVIEPVKYQWNLRIKVAGNQNTKKSTPDHKPDDLLRFLAKASREMRALRMRTKYVTSDDKIVYVSPPTIVRTAINVILKQWTGSVIITIREV